MRRAAILVVATAVVAVLGGCGESAPDSSDPVTLERMSHILRDAREFGVSEEQLDVLEAAVTSAKMSYEDLAQLLPSYQECVAGIGGEVHLLGPQDEPGQLPTPGYGVVFPPGQDDDDAAKAEVHCSRVTIGYAEAMYQAQPAALEAYDSYFESHRGTYIKCLQEHGVVLEDDATIDELVNALADDLRSVQAPGETPCYQGASLAVRRR